jgi:para-nitrobenzyl esterase
LDGAEQNGIKFATEHHAASIKELRALPADALIYVPDPKAGMAGAFRFAPIVDGWVLPDTPNNMNAKGSDSDVPVLAGYQADEFALFFQPIHTLDEYHNLIQKRYGDMAAEFEKLYPVTKDEDIKTVKVTAGQTAIACRCFFGRAHASRAIASLSSLITSIVPFLGRSILNSALSTPARFPTSS